VILGVVFAVYTFQPRCHNRALPRQLVCGTNLKGLAAAMVVYGSQFDDKYPTPDRWCDLLIEHAKLTPKHFVCPASDAREGESSYALNDHIGDKSFAEMPPDVVVLFETNSGKDASGRQELLRNRDSYEFFWRQYDRSEKVYRLRWNQVGGPEILTKENHKGKGCNILFNDGHVEFVPSNELSQLKWKAEQANK
jgi:prepilin-type processing-associated H-X9-DG protein